MNGTKIRETLDLPKAEENLLESERFAASCSAEASEESTGIMRSKAKARKLTNTGERNWHGVVVRQYDIPFLHLIPRPMVSAAGMDDLCRPCTAPHRFLANSSAQEKAYTTSLTILTVIWTAWFVKFYHSSLTVCFL